MDGFERLSGELERPDRLMERTFRCHVCLDTCYVSEPVQTRMGEYQVARKCLDGMCPAWRNHREDVRKRTEGYQRDVAEYRRQKIAEEGSDD